MTWSLKVWKAMSFDLKKLLYLRIPSDGIGLVVMIGVDGSDIKFLGQFFEGLQWGIMQDV